MTLVWSVISPQWFGPLPVPKVSLGELSWRAHQIRRIVLGGGPPWRLNWPCRRVVCQVGISLRVDEGVGAKTNHDAQKCSRRNTGERAIHQTWHSRELRGYTSVRSLQRRANDAARIC